jgi:hypothetical protein
MTTILSDATPGGIWSSGNPAVASVGSLSGIVTGVTPGSATISYTLATGCNANAVVTVNASPLITGASSVCVGSSTALSSPGGGTWSSSMVSVATVGSSTGVVTGWSAGYPIITYTLPSGCFSIVTMAVDPLPAIIAGPSVVCVGATGTLTNASSGGIWSSGSSLVASVGSSSGVVLGVATGSSAISYTLPTGCMRSVTLTVNSLPNVYSVTGGGSYCAGGAGVLIGLSGSNTGVTYQLYNGTASVGSPVPGTGSAISFGLATISGTYTVVATSSVTGCAANMTGSASVSGTPLPAAYTVTGGGAICAGTAGLPIGLSGSVVGIAYQLYRGGTALGAPLPGSGAPLSFGLVTMAGTYSVIATDLSSGCLSSMTGTPTVIVNPLPIAYSVTGGGVACSGGTGVSIGLSNSTTGVTYQLFRGTTLAGSVAGTGAPVSFGLFNIPGSYTVVATNSATGCSANMSGSVAVTSSSAPAVYTVSGGGTYCAGGAGFNVNISNSQTGVNYQLYLGGAALGSPVAGTGAGFSFGLQTTAGVYTVVATDGATGCTSNMTGSAAIVVNPLPVVYMVTLGGSYCAGGTGVPVGLSGSQTGVNYQLLRGGSVVSTMAGTGSAITFASQTVAGTYTVVAVNPTTSCTSNMSGSTLVAINPLPTVATVTGGGGYCAGGSGVAVGLSGSQIGVDYTLRLAGSPVGTPLPGTGVAFSFGLQTATGTYTISATDASTGCSSNMSGSVVVTINATPVAYALTGGGSYCSGGSGVLVGLANSQTSATYQLYLGGVPVGGPVTGTGSAISFGLQMTAGTYTVTGTNLVTGCTGNMTGSATVSVTPLPTVYSVGGGGSYCSGGSGVVVSLSGSQVGVNYQLYNGSSTVGSTVPGTGSAISFGPFTTAGTYTITATGSGCANNMSGSAVITISTPPVAYAVTGGGSYCLGGTGVSVGLSSSAVGVNYQLFNGSTAIATLPGTGAPLSFGLHTATGTYTVIATDAATACSNNMTGSAIVSTNALPATYTVTGGGNYCLGGAGVSIGLSGSATGISYQLYSGSSTVGGPVTGTGSAITFGTFTTGGTYTVIATDLSTGCVANMTGSATIAVNPLPSVYAVSGGGSYCTGGTGVTVGLVGSQSGVLYQLYFGSVPLGPTVTGTGAAISFGLQTFAGTYTVVASNPTTACTNNMSGSATVVINAAPVAMTVTGGGTGCGVIGAGFPVGLAGSATGVNYQLYVGGTMVGGPVAGTGASISFGLQTALGTYTVVATDVLSGCSSNMIGSAVILVTPVPAIVPVTGGGGYCVGGAGVPVGLTGSAIGINYQLYRGGVPVGSPVAGIGAGFSFGLQTIAGIYTVTGTHAVTGCTSTMAGSATVTINTLPAIYTVTGGGSYCSGGTGLTVGLSGSAVGITYTLYRSGTPVGSLTGTGLPIHFGTFTAAGTYTIVATNLTTTCVSNMAGSAIISVNPLPVAYSVTGGGSYCSGSAGVAVGLSNSSIGVNYQLYRAGSPIGLPVSGTGSAISFGLQALTGAYTVVATDVTTLCVANMSGSVTVTISALPVIHTVTGGGSVCTAGMPVGLSSSTVGVNYQLYMGGTPIGGIIAGTGSALTFGVFTTAGIYTISGTSATTTCTVNMSGSATITATSLPAIYTVSGGGSLCTGGSGHAISLSGSTVGVNYQLYNGAATLGSPMAGTGSAITFGTFTSAGGYTVIATNTATGCTRSMSGSATIIVNPLPTAFTVTGGGSYCPGGSGVTVGLGGSTSGISYKLYRGTTWVGSAVTGTGSAISFGLQTVAGTYTVVATNTSTGCTSNMTGSVTVGVYTTPAITGSIYTVAPSATITLTGSPSGGSWASSTTSVATISTGGVVTGVTLGTTTITYTSTSGCVATQSIGVTPTGHRDAATDSTGAMAALPRNSNFYVVPNPNHGVFTVKGALGTTDDEEVTIEITDVIGQVVYTNKVVAKNGELDEKIQLRNHVASGMYLLTLHTTSESKVFHVVVEQ